ncbi:unnamed protein product [Durusdinium trenchii]|uniref:Uncharacterized protein n=1 Tax=Durusdinium trenchii TaxID=1381693 RepID=A0ABP0SIM1_9DINO
MAWRALLCCLLAEVATAETASCSPSEDEETAQRTSFVQMAKHLEKHLESREAALPGVCLRSLSWEIYRKPIQEVLKDHPNYDGWCIYGIMGELFSKCAVAREVRQLVPFTDVIQKKESPMHLGRTQRFVLEGSEVNVDRMHVLDDLYCHVNGWYELSSEAASNYSYVEEASKKVLPELGREGARIPHHVSGRCDEDLGRE